MTELSLDGTAIDSTWDRGSSALSNSRANFLSPSNADIEISKYRPDNAR